jgi:hypothetical protein
MCLTVAKLDHNACVDELSLKGEPLQPISSEPVEGEAPQSSVLVQQSDVTKDGEEVGAPPFPADKPGASCSPEESVSPAQPRLDESGASTPTELTGKGHGGLFESMSVAQSEDQRAQAPETSGMLGSEEPAPHHIDPPAEFTIEKGKYQLGESNLKQMASIFVHLTRCSISSRSRGRYTKGTLDRPR